MNRPNVLTIMKLLGALIFLTAVQFHTFAVTTVTVDGLRYKLFSDGTATITFQTEDSSNYDGLVNLEIPKNITYESRKYTVTAIDAMAFQNCATLETIVIPPTIEFIGMETMTDPTYPSSTLLTKDVELNRHSPFYGCSSLSKVTFLDGGRLRLEMNARYSIYHNSDKDSGPYAESITEPLFEGCPVRELYFGRTLAYNKCVRTVSANGQTVSCTYVPEFWSLYKSNFSLEVLTIGPEVSELPEGFAARCQYLRKVTFGKKLKVIPRRCFSSSGISDIQIGESIDSIAPNAFEQCYYLKSVVIPTNVNVVGDPQNGESAFFYKLTNLYIADSDKPLRLAAMPTSSELEQLHIGRGIDGSWPFHGCKLKNVEMSGGFSELPAEAFKDNTSLTSVILSERSTRIPKYAFSGCGLTELPDLKNVTVVEDLAFVFITIEQPKLIRNIRV